MPGRDTKTRGEMEGIRPVVLELWNNRTGRTGHAERSGGAFEIEASELCAAGVVFSGPFRVSVRIRDRVAHRRSVEGCQGSGEGGRGGGGSRRATHPMISAILTLWRMPRSCLSRRGRRGEVSPEHSSSSVSPCPEGPREDTFRRNVHDLEASARDTLPCAVGRGRENGWDRRQPEGAKGGGDGHHALSPRKEEQKVKAVASCTYLYALASR